MILSDHGKLWNHACSKEMSNSIINNGPAVGQAQLVAREICWLCHDQVPPHLHLMYGVKPIYRGWESLTKIHIYNPVYSILFEISPYSLRWHHGRDSVSNHQPHDCLLNRLFRHRSKKISKLRVTGLCAGNSPHKGPVTRKMFPFDDVIMFTFY